MEFLLFSFNKTAVDYAKKENHQKVVALLSKNIIEQNQAILKNFEKSKTETEKLRDENNSLLKRIKELEEECGLKVDPSELIDLTELTYGTDGIYTSPGLLDEFIRLFAWRKTMKHEEIQALEGKLGGESAHEQIVLKIVKFADLWKTTPDAKTLCALQLYQNLLAEGKI